MFSYLVVIEEQLSQALTKNSSLEKAKTRLAGEVEDLLIDVERVSGVTVLSCWSLVYLSFMTHISRGQRGPCTFIPR